MGEWAFDPLIARQIIAGRIMRIPTLRGMAEYNGGVMSDRLWQAIEPKWQWHDTISTKELQRRCLEP